MNCQAVVVPRPSDRKASRDIVVRKRGGGLQYISDGNPAYTCLHYILLYPWGDLGWHYDLQLRVHQPGDRGVPKRLSQISHYAYEMHPRQDKFSLLLRAGRLFQQWLVDMWASAEQNRLNYLVYHQDDIRASLYGGLEDALGAADFIDLNDIGRRVVLPSSFTGGPRYLQQKLQDALSLARFFHKIDIFLTMTCNPQWPEIARELLPGQTAADWPELVARVLR